MDKNSNNKRLKSRTIEHFYSGIGHKICKIYSYLVKGRTFTTQRHTPTQTIWEYLPPRLPTMKIYNWMVGWIGDVFYGHIAIPSCHTHWFPRLGAWSEPRLICRSNQTQFQCCTAFLHIVNTSWQALIERGSLFWLIKAIILIWYDHNNAFKIYEPYFTLDTKPPQGSFFSTCFWTGAL